MAEAVAEVAAAVAVIAADVEKIAVWGLVIDKAPFLCLGGGFLQKAIAKQTVLVYDI